MKKKQKKQTIQCQDVRMFVAWINTLICDGGNLYRLAKIYERDYDEINSSKDQELLDNLKHIDEVDP